MDAFQIGTRDPLFFMHIPKTAGMSMRLYLSEQYQARDVCPALRWHGLLGREEDVQSFRLIHGHFRYHLRPLLAANTRILVMLRDPLRRTISALRHLQRDPSFHQDHILARDMTMAEMIRHPVLMRNQNNVQARFLCASGAPEDISNYLQETLTSNPDADAGDLEDPPEFGLAAERLESIDFVGVTENIGAVVAVMAREMNYHPPLYFPFINDDPSRGDPLRQLTADDLDILRDYNSIDLKLYEYAHRMIERREFAHSMRQLTRNGIYRVPPGSFEIPLSGIIPGSGWYEAEQDPEKCWRWTGPTRHFTLELPLRQDASYRMVMIIGGSQRPEDFTAEVNDVPIPFEPPEEGRRNQHVLIIPRELLALSSGFCRIRFDTGEAIQRSADDIRALGVCVGGITFECLPT